MQSALLVNEKRKSNIEIVNPPPPPPLSKRPSKLDNRYQGNYNRPPQLMINRISKPDKEVDKFKKKNSLHHASSSKEILPIKTDINIIKSQTAVNSPLKKLEHFPSVSPVAVNKKSVQSDNKSINNNNNKINENKNENENNKPKTIVDNLLQDVNSEAESFNIEKSEDDDIPVIYGKKPSIEVKPIIKEKHDSDSDEIVLSFDLNKKKPKILQWGDVKIREYKSTLSDYSVPQSNGVPLGLSWEITIDNLSTKLDDFERWKAENEENVNLNKYQKVGIMSAMERLWVVQKAGVENEKVTEMLKEVENTKMQRFNSSNDEIEDEEEKKLSNSVYLNIYYSFQGILLMNLN